MKTHLTIKRAFAALAVLSMTTGAAFAVCPTLPDGPQSDNVTNGEQRALCLQQELHNSTVDQNTQTQLRDLQTDIQRQQIQRRFDNLPRIGPPDPWEQ